MELSGTQRDALLRQLTRSFSLEEFELLVGKAINKPLERLAGPGVLDTVIFRALTAAERSGELREIITAARDERPHVTALARIAEEMLTMLEDSVLDPKAQDLIALVRGHKVDETVLATYRHFAPSNAIHLEMPVDRVAYGIKRLVGSTPRRKDDHPLLLFAAYLGKSEKVPSLARKAIDEWLTETLKMLGLPASKGGLKRKAKTLAEQFENTALYLLVSARPMGDSLLSVRAWTQLFDENGEPKSGSDPEPLGDYETCTTESFSALLTQFVTGAEERRSTSSSLTIEVFLPIELLSYAVDQQLYQAPEQEPARFGTRYPLVVRSFNRAYEARPLVQKEWLRLWKRSRPNKQKALRGGRELFNGRYGLVVRDDYEASHVILDFAPGPEVIRVIVATGTSFALWPRKEADGYPAIAAALEKNLVWPEAVRKQRVAAARCEEPEAHAGSHLTLLWDEPSRIPPDVRRFEMTGDAS